MNARARLAICLAAVCCVVGPWGGLDVRAQAQTTKFEAKIEIVTIPVWVVEGGGRPVTGLKAADFQVEQDGRPVKVVAFHEVDAGAPAAGASPETERLPEARRQFLLLFDLSFSSPSGIVRSRQAARDFVRDDLAPSDLVAVATSSVQSGVKVLVGFTSDRKQLDAAVDSLDVLNVERASDPLNLSYRFAEPGLPVPALATADASDTDGKPRRSAEQEIQEVLRQTVILYRQSERAAYRQKANTSLEGIRQLARALERVRGRKQVLYFASGFNDAAFVGEQGNQALKDAAAVTEGRIWEVQSESHFGDSSLREDMEAAIQILSGSDCVVHTIDVSGLSAEKGDVDKVEGSADRLASTGRESLARLASGTGGRFIKDTNDIGTAFGEVLESTRRYYLVGFTPEGAKGAGTFHRLRVRVAGKGRTVSHRTGFVEHASIASEGALTRRFAAAEAIVKDLRLTELDVRAMAMPYRNTAGRVTVPVVVEVRDFGLVDGRSTLPVEIYGYAVSDQGTIQDSVSLNAKLDLAKAGDRLRDRGLQAHGAFTLPAGRHSLRFLVRDAETGKAGTRSLTVTVPAFEGATEALVYPPLIMDDPKQWLLLPLASRLSGAVESPFKVATEPFAPVVHATLRNDEAQRICVMTFEGDEAYPQGTPFELRFQLVDAEGKPARAGRLDPLRNGAEEDGFHRFVFHLTPSGVAPGDYSLVVKFKDPRSGVVTEAAQNVTFQ